MKGIVCALDDAVVGSVAFEGKRVKVSVESPMAFVVHSGTTDVSLASEKRNVLIVCVDDSC